MTANWPEPQVEDVKAFMSSVVVDRATDNDNVQKILSVVVQRFRGIIGRCNTLSDSEAQVPPEALQHVMVLSIFSLLVGTPNFGFVIRGADGAETGFGYQVKQAERWLEAVQNGLSVTYPTNPQTSYPNLIRYGSEDYVDTTSA